MHSTSDLDQLSPAQLRALVSELATKVDEQAAAIVERDGTIARYQVEKEKLTQEIALLRRYRYGRRSEGLDSRQQSLLDEAIDADIAALETELAKLGAGDRSRSDRGGSAEQR